MRLVHHHGEAEEGTLISVALRATCCIALERMGSPLFCAICSLYISVS